MALVSTGSRAQLQLIHWEQFIASDKPVRVIDAFVDLLDVEQLGFTIKSKSREGRLAFSPGSWLRRCFYYTLIRQLRLHRNSSIFWDKRVAPVAKSGCSALFALKWPFLSSSGCFYSKQAGFLPENVGSNRAGMGRMRLPGGWEV